jgi:hypothetical protein
MSDEIALAAKTGELTSKLKKLYKALASIPAASIESERAFSIAGGFATKIRSQLSDKTLDKFSFAKTYFKNQDLAAGVTHFISWFSSTFLFYPTFKGGERHEFRISRKWYGWIDLG